MVVVGTSATATAATVALDILEVILEGIVAVAARRQRARCSARCSRWRKRMRSLGGSVGNGLSETFEMVNVALECSHCRAQQLNKDRKRRGDRGRDREE